MDEITKLRNAVLFFIMILPYVGYFVEGNITITSCVSSVLAFMLLAASFAYRFSRTD